MLILLSGLQQEAEYRATDSVVKLGGTEENIYFILELLLNFCSCSIEY